MESLPEETVRAALAGIVTELWALQEVTIKLLVSSLVTPDETTGYLITHDAEWPWLEQKLVTLARHRIGDPALLKKFEAMVQVLDDAEQRARAVQRSYPAPVGLRSAEGEARAGAAHRAVSVSELTETVVVVNDVGEQLRRMVAELASRRITYPGD